MKRILAAMTALGAVAIGSQAALAGDMTGVTATEIKFGQTLPYSGPASIYGAVGKAEDAYFRMINEQGGINVRKLVFLSLDDGYLPPKAVEQTRKLVEEDQVAFIFGSLGTPGNAAIRAYLNDNKVPQLLIGSGADQFIDPEHFPWTVPFNPSYRNEGRIYAKYILDQKPGAKVAVLYQHDDLGRDYLKGFHDVFGDRYAQIVVKEESYEVADPTVDSQIVSLQQSGADVLVMITLPKQTAQAFAKAWGLGWRPLRIVDVNAAFLLTQQPGMMAIAADAISATPYNDITNPAEASQPGVAAFFQFVDKYLDPKEKGDALAYYGYGVAQTLAQILKQCGDDLSRDNILKQATNLRDFHAGNLRPGIAINSSPTDYHLIHQMQILRFNGTTSEPVGGIISAD